MESSHTGFLTVKSDGQILHLLIVDSDFCVVAAFVYYRLYL